MANTSGSGAVIPGEPVASLPAGTVTVTVESAVGENDGLFVRDENGELVLDSGEKVPATSENLMARCVYPDGFVKNHQVKTTADLAEKVLLTIKNRYGVAGDVTVTAMPEAVATGATIVMEV